MKRFLRTVLLLIIVAGLGVGGYFAVINRKININHWFVGGMVRGADISSYQGEVDMVKLSEQNISFVYIKATEGGTYVDKYFATNFKNAREANLPMGAYHFFSFKVDGATQAMHYIDTVGELSNGDLIPVVDMELSSEEKQDPPEKSEVVSSLKTFVAVLEEKYKCKPMIYSTKDFYEKYLRDDFKDYPRWVRSVLWPVYIEAGDDWFVWQYDDRGELEGYNGEEKYIDLNVINPNHSLNKIEFH